MSTTSLQDGQAENQPGNSFALESTVSSSNAIAAVPVVDNLSVDEIMGKVVGYSSAENISNPVEILRCLQKDLVTGQPLEVTDAMECSRGQTNLTLLVTAVNPSPIRLDQHRKRSALSCLQYENSCLP